MCAVAYALLERPSNGCDTRNTEEERNMKNWSSKVAMLLAPMVLFTACGGGGGDGSSASNTTGQTSNVPVQTTAALSSVPLAGTAVTHCSDTGVAVVDSIIDAVSSIGGSSLPTQLPKLSDVLAMADLGKLPIIGGLIVNAQGQLETLSAADVTSLIPGGVPSLGNLPIPGQLPAVCSSLVGSLPAGATTDPSVLLAALGNPTGALGVIPVLDASQNPVGALLATVPAGLVPGTSGISLPGVTTLPDLTELVPLDPSTVPVVGGQLSSLAHTLLGLLDSHSLLGGNLLTMLLGLVP
jgi:hypothetical protein